jgi:LPS export ABC transporter protein LptC
MRRIVMLAAAVMMLTACEEKLRPSLVPMGEGEIPGQESWRSRVTFSDSGRVKAVLWAGHITVYGTAQQTTMDDSIHVEFFDETGRRASILTARRGRVDDETRDFAAYEQVVVTSDSGTVLKTDSLFWDNQTRKITTDAHVEITSPTEQIRGQGLISDQSLRDYRIFRVTGQAVVKEK